MYLLVLNLKDKRDCIVRGTTLIINEKLTVSKVYSLLITHY